MRTVVTVLTVLMSGIVYASDVSDQLLRCRQLASHVERLDCYEELAASVERDQVVNTNEEQTRDADNVARDQSTSVKIDNVEQPRDPEDVASDPVISVTEGEKTMSDDVVSIKGERTPPRNVDDDQVVRVNEEQNRDANDVAPDQIVSVKVEEAEQVVNADSERRRNFGLPRDVLEPHPQISGVIAGIQRLPHGQYQITMEDGQVWRETEKHVQSRIAYAIGDRVTIEKALLGSYRLRVVASKYTSKVKRVR